jgi:hypothetical protein
MSVRPERLGEIDRAAASAAPSEEAAAATATVNEVEGEIREFVRRDVSVFRRNRSDATAGGDVAADSINSLIQRVSASSLLEVERVINELTNVRDMLRSEAERVQREIASYASLSQGAMSSMKIIAESLGQWQPPSSPQIRRAGSN